MCQAAVHNGADAVYIGAPYFNARKRTSDFSPAELKEMIDYCHLYGVKVNLALNVVIFENELLKVTKLLEEILPLGPDALIIQDLGLARMVRRMAPHQRIHASTQMTVTNSDAIDFLSDLDISRFVLGRENSLKEIKVIKEKTKKELEVFVHGALCVAYSGQCFTSESIGGRSANRGQCAQSCRLDYELWVDDHKKELGDIKYLVSPKDLLGISKISELMEIGVHSFKVEGRLKTPEYVATAARNYREVMDGAALNLEKRTFDLSMTYSRSFFTGWLDGVDHQNLVDGTFSAHRGIKVGEILRLRDQSVLISSTHELVAGMGLLFVGKKENGSKIFSVKKVNQNFEIQLLNKNLGLSVGDKVFINSYESFASELKRTWNQKDLVKRIPLKIEVQGKIGSVLEVRVEDPEGRVVTVFSESSVAEATNYQPQMIENELTSLGATAYVARDFKISSQDNIFIHQKELKKLRRDFVAKMNESRTLANNGRISRFEFQDLSEKSLETTKLNILLRTKDQVKSFISRFESGVYKNYEKFIGDIILDFEFGRDYAESAQIIKASGLDTTIATTRILKPLEYYNLNQLIRISPEKVLVRNLGALQYLKTNSNLKLVGDFSLNVTNSLTAKYLIEKGLSRLNLSYDLNQNQLMDLINSFDPSLLEITVHQYMPEFHMEHCVFAAFLSQGSSFRDCGKPCERHEVKLKDPYGHWHFLKADHECRNTFYQATPQSASFLVESLISQGIQSVRFEALNEMDKDLNTKILFYLRLLKREISYETLLSELKLKEVYGLGTGQLSKNDSYQDRKKSY